MDTRSEMPVPTPMGSPLKPICPPLPTVFEGRGGGGGREGVNQLCHATAVIRCAELGHQA